MIAPNTISRIELEASICKDSFYEFVQRMWGAVIPQPLVMNWHIQYLCDELQVVAERVFKEEQKEYDVIINIPPGSTKSTICSIMFPAWIWCVMPSARIICGSYAHPLSLDLSRKCRDVILSERYHSLFPSIILREDQNTKGYFANTKGGERYSVGTNGSVTGMHAHFIIVDDPLDPMQAASEVELNTANRWIGETLMTRKVNKAVTPTILIMQRLHQNDPTGNWLASRPEDIKWICLPGEIFPSDRFSRQSVHPRSLRKFYIEGLLDPNRLSRDTLDKMRKQLLEYGYACQILQTPIPPTGGTFNVQRLVIDIPPLKFKRIIRYWDKAGTGGRGCYTVGVLMGIDFLDRVWILDVVRGQWNSDDREKRIKQTAMMDGKAIKIAVEQEPGSGGKDSAQMTVRNLLGWKVTLDRPVGDKVMRADPFSYPVNAGNVYLAKAAWNREYIAELEYFPHSKFKDQVDASSGAFSMLTNFRKTVGALDHGK